MNIQTGNKTKLETVSPAQWVAANACILAEIVEESGGVNAAQLTRDYMSHTTKIGILATHFTWKCEYHISEDNKCLTIQIVEEHRWELQLPSLDNT